MPRSVRSSSSRSTSSSSSSTRISDLSSTRIKVPHRFATQFLVYLGGGRPGRHCEVRKDEFTYMVEQGGSKGRNGGNVVTREKKVVYSYVRPKGRSVSEYFDVSEDEETFTTVKERRKGGRGKSGRRSRKGTDTWSQRTTRMVEETDSEEEESEVESDDEVYAGPPLGRPVPAPQFPQPPTAAQPRGPGPARPGFMPAGQPHMAPNGANFGRPAAAMPGRPPMGRPPMAAQGAPGPPRPYGVPVQG